MTVKTKDQTWDGITGRRKKTRPRRWLVDLTLGSGTDRRLGKRDR